MHGVRRLIRDFTATAVKEHLRSQLDAGPEPKLTPKETELLRFISERSPDWQALVSDDLAQIP